MALRFDHLFTLTTALSNCFVNSVTMVGLVVGADANCCTVKSCGLWNFNSPS